MWSYAQTATGCAVWIVNAYWMHSCCSCRVVQSHLSGFVVPGLNRAFDFVLSLFEIVPYLETTVINVSITVTVDQISNCETAGNLLFSLLYRLTVCHHT